MIRFDLRSFRQTAALVVSVVFLISSVGTAAAQSLKIGFPVPLTGPQSPLGKDLRDGFQLYMDQIGSEVEGHDIEVFVTDTASKPSQGISKVRELVESEGVDVLSGVINSGVAFGIRDYVTKNQIPLVLGNAGAPGLTQEKRSPFILRVSFENGQHDRFGGWYAYNKMGYRDIVTVAWDYSAGRDKAASFQKAFKKAGGNIVNEYYAPLGTSDFAPYLTNIISQRNQIDAVWAFMAGSDAIKFIKQYSSYGLKDQVELFPIGDLLAQDVLPAMGDAAIGIKNYTHYAWTLQTEENQQFVEAYRDEYGDFPSIFSEQGYVAARVITESVKEVNGNIDNTFHWLSAMRSARFMAPRGQFQFDSLQNVILPVYLREVKRVDGELQNVITGKISNIDQFWKPEYMQIQSME